MWDRSDNVLLSEVAHSTENNIPVRLSYNIIHDRPMTHDLCRTEKNARVVTASCYLARMLFNEDEVKIK